MRKKTTEEFVDEISERDFWLMEPYDGAHIKREFMCKSHGHKWSASPTMILCGRGCPKCSAEGLSDRFSVKNKILKDFGEYVEIDTSTPGRGASSSLMDNSDFLNIKGSIYINANGYPETTIKRKKTRIHKIIMDGCGEVDHINRIKTDNRRVNLREVTRGQNNQNHVVRCDSATGIKGVSFDKRYGTWQAHITKDGVATHLGSYDNVDFAVGARLQAERELHGEYRLGGRFEEVHKINGGE